MALSFETSRLNVIEIEDGFALSERTSLLERIPDILTPSVVENLPPHFHDVASVESAEVWLERMLSESRLLQIKSENSEIIGFLFASVENGSYAHIGYLLAEEYWGKGLASELLKGFIAKVTETEQWLKLVGGVDQSNVASSGLLKKSGFVEQVANENGVVFYEYTIPRPQA